MRDRETTCCSLSRIIDQSICKRTARRLETTRLHPITDTSALRSSAHTTIPNNLPLSRTYLPYLLPACHTPSRPLPYALSSLTVRPLRASAPISAERRARRRLACHGCVLVAIASRDSHLPSLLGALLRSTTCTTGGPHSPLVTTCARSRHVINTVHSHIAAPAAI